MTGFLLFIAILIIWSLLRSKPKEKPVSTIIKNVKYYESQFPDIIKPLPPKPEKPPIVVNIYNNHNHLHVYPASGESTPEGNQPHQH